MPTVRPRRRRPADEALKEINCHGVAIYEVAEGRDRMGSGAGLAVQPPHHAEYLDAASRGRWPAIRWCVR